MLLDKIFSLLAAIAPPQQPPAPPDPVVTEPAHVDGCGDEWDDSQDHDDSVETCEEF